MGGGLDVREFGAVPDDDGLGNGTDSTEAINTALTFAAPGQPVELVAEWPSRRQYRITGTLWTKTGRVLVGPGGFGWGTSGVMLNFYGPDDADAISTGPGSGFSRQTLAGFALYDKRTNPARTGRGIVVDNVYNGTSIRDVFVRSFYDNVFVGSMMSGRDSDCVSIERLWTMSPLRYGLNLERVSNVATVRDVAGDTPAGNTGQALIRLAGSSGDTVIEIFGVKHECGNGAHTLLIEGNPTVFASVVTMRGSGPGGDVVRIAGSGRGVTLAAVSTRHVEHGDSKTVAANLLNVLGRAPPLALPTSDPANKRLVWWDGAA